MNPDPWMMTLANQCDIGSVSQRGYTIEKNAKYLPYQIPRPCWMSTTMPSLADRLRDLFAGTRDGPRDTPQQAGPMTTAPGPKSGSKDSVTNSADAKEILEGPKPVSSTEWPPAAQGQELLGPCRECDGYWTRELVRGQKPLTCPVCKRRGPPKG